jgi:hypothetical protein
MADLLRAQSEAIRGNHVDKRPIGTHDGVVLADPRV